MTWTRCPHCNRSTFAYRDHCEYCHSPLGDFRPLFGAGGTPLPRFICPQCAFINEPDAEGCVSCGRLLAPGSVGARPRDQPMEPRVPPPVRRRPPAEHVLEKPERFGRYVLLRRLPSESISERFVAEMAEPPVPGVHNPVVVERLRPEVAAQEHLCDRFMQGARIATGLSHVNIAMILDGGEEAGVPFVVSEYVRAARDLSEIMDHGGVPPRLAAYVVGQVAEAVDYAQRRCDRRARPGGIAHPDLIPGRVLVNPAGELKLIGFDSGLVVASLLRTDPSLLVKRLPFLPPEQLAGSDADVRANVYCLGSLLAELLAAREEEPPEQMRHGEPSGSDQGDLTALASIVKKAMANDAAARYANAKDVRKECLAYLMSGKQLVCGRHLGDYVRSMFDDPSPG